MQIDTIWRNCTNEELLEVLADCPEVVEELKRIGYNELVNSYDALLKTKAEAQLASIKETKQELRNRILATR